jgi:hypothetical protein
MTPVVIIGAGGDGVVSVQRNGIIGADGGGDAALRPGAGRAVA